MNLISQILELNSSIKKQFSLEKSGMFFFEDHQKQNTDFYELFEHNYNLIVALLEYHYQKIPTDEVERENIIYSLYGGLQYHKSILSSLSHESYGVMFSLIRVTIENIFHSLWLFSNMGAVEIFEDKNNPLSPKIYYFLKTKGKIGKFKYGDFIQSFCSEKSKMDSFLRESFGYDFLCQFSHGDGLSAIGEHFKANDKNNQIDESKVEGDYKKMGTSYILFLQWAQLYTLKNLFSYTYNFNTVQEDPLKYLKQALELLENEIGKDDKEVFTMILENKCFMSCKIKITTSKG